jgi:hypothetical protein
MEFGSSFLQLFFGIKKMFWTFKLSFDVDILVVLGA